LKKRRRRSSVSFNFIIGAFFDVFRTGLTALMRQKIAETGMIANQTPGEIDWEVIPENSIHDDPMDIDSRLDEWEDVFEEDLGADGQTVSQKVMRHAGLQNIITCVLVFSPPVMYL
jgi:hypothetical protein